jgi:hypothetical protein
VARVDITFTNLATVGLMAFVGIVLIKMVIRALPVPAVVRQYSDLV